MSSCSALNIIDDLRRLIFKIASWCSERLCLKDYLGLREICSSWRAIVNDAIAKKHCYPLPEMPLIVLISKDSQATLYSLMTECERFPKIPIFKKKQNIHGSVEGWLIVSENAQVDSASIFLFNPVTNSRVSVPSKLNFPSNSPFFPVYRLFDDQSWTIIETDQGSEVHFMDIEFVGMKLYVKTDSSSNGTLVYDLKDSTNGPPRPKLLAALPVIDPPPLSYRIGNIRHNKGNIMRCLAKDEALGELFLIQMFCNSVHEIQKVGYLNIVTEYVSPPQIKAVEVFKLDTSKEPSQWLKLEKTKDMRLNDLVVFVSGCKGIVMSRAALNSSTQGSFPGNGVYYAFKHRCSIDDPWRGFQLGMISFTDNSSKFFSVEKSNHFDVPYPFWLAPSI
ncbi:hypothetical protein SESBI_47479 [Sesbania bispinosa]|nr:hypothetical protein SESBI_47479 [Sesbania bispinosa]